MSIMLDCFGDDFTNPQPLSACTVQVYLYSAYRKLNIFLCYKVMFYNVCVCVYKYIDYVKTLRIYFSCLINFTVPIL